MNKTPEQIIKALVDAMNKSVEDGSTDHLDATDDAGEFWYNAIEDAKKFLHACNL